MWVTGIGSPFAPVGCVRAGSPPASIERLFIRNAQGRPFPTGLLMVFTYTDGARWVASIGSLLSPEGNAHGVTPCHF